MSQTTSALCNAVFGWALIPEQENPLKGRRASCVLSPQPSTFCSLDSPLRAPLLRPERTPDPVLSSLNPHLTLPATEGNKTLLPWKLLTERRRAAYETSSEETEAHIWSLPVCGLGGGGAQPSMKMFVCPSCVKDQEAVRWTDETEEAGKQKGRRLVCAQLDNHDLS